MVMVMVTCGCGGMIDGGGGSMAAKMVIIMDSS